MEKRERILRSIKKLIKKNAPDAEVYLYGSQAREDAGTVSDWDLLILLNSNNVPFELETEFMDEFYDLELKTGEIFSPMIYSKNEWEMKYRITPLFDNIQKEGVRIV